MNSLRASFVHAHAAHADWRVALAESQRQIQTQIAARGAQQGELTVVHAGLVLPERLLRAGGRGDSRCVARGLARRGLGRHDRCRRGRERRRILRRTCPGVDGRAAAARIVSAVLGPAAAACGIVRVRRPYRAGSCRRQHARLAGVAARAQHCARPPVICSADCRQRATVRYTWRMAYSPAVCPGWPLARKSA